MNFLVKHEQGMEKSNDWSNQTSQVYQALF